MFSLSLCTRSLADPGHLKMPCHLQVERSGKGQASRFLAPPPRGPEAPRKPQPNKKKEKPRARVAGVASPLTGKLADATLGNHPMPMMPILSRPKDPEIKG